MHVHPPATLKGLFLSALLVPALLALVPATARAEAGSVPSRPHLLVKGEAERTVKPDRFTIDLLLQDTDMDADAARARVQANARLVVEAMKARGALPGTIEAASLSIAPQHEFQERRRVFVGTRVSRSIRGTFASHEGLRGFLGQIKADEHLQVASLRSGYAGAAALRGELKAEAAAQTRRSAEGLARAYGTRITGLYTISDVAPSFAYGVQAGTWPARRDDGNAGGGFHPPAPPAPAADIGAVVVTGSRIDPEVLESGTLTFTENVYAIFLIAESD